MSQKPFYAEGVLNDMAADRITDVQRRFFKRFPLDMPETEEPLEEQLSAVDDDAPDPEPPTPDGDLLSPEEYKEAMGTFQARVALVIYRRNVSIPLPSATNNDTRPMSYHAHAYSLQASHTHQSLVHYNYFHHTQ